MITLEMIPTPADLARFMLLRFEENGGVLAPPLIVSEIVEQFGDAYVVDGVLDRPYLFNEVLDAWDELTNGVVRWSSAQRCWRRVTPATSFSVS